MQLSVYGAGYVGLVSAVCLAKLGHQVLCFDNNKEKISTLMQGDCPLYESELAALLKQQLHSGNLRFSNVIREAVAFATVHSIAVGTPQSPHGNADVSQVEQAVMAIAESTQRDCVIVIKSTVPVGTGDRLQQQVGGLQRGIKIHVASNPEFLREGSAVADFLQPARIVLGGEVAALNILQELYQPLAQQGIPLLRMSRASAELSKYAANAMLASKISLVNYVSQFAEVLGANMDEVIQTLASDKRIGSDYLQTGIGFGGSCFPKDINALLAMAEDNALESGLLTAIQAINTRQKHWVSRHIQRHFAHALRGLRIGLWGVAFKPGTDDIREASSLTIIDDLTQAGVQLWIYDPQAMANAQQLLAQQHNIHWCQNADAVLDAKLDGLVIATEWQEFKHYPLRQLQKKLNQAPVWDGRNCYALAEVAKTGLRYYSVGRPTCFKDNHAN